MNDSQTTPADSVRSLRVWLALIVLSPGTGLAAAPGSTQVDRASEILKHECLSCHGSIRASGLDLRTREGMLLGGNRGPAVEPGQPDASLLYRAVAHMGDLAMPPGEKQLPDQDLETLKAWIEAGASWPDAVDVEAGGPAWWSFRPPVRPEPPQILDAAHGVRNPIDNFVLARLHSQGLKPAPEASRLELVRRAYIDLIGLPPTPEQVESFLRDESPKAFEKLVDRLLESPAYGERWARHWLDVVRYADSGGFETDEYYPNAWRYRDYVIKSFNEDKPYDRFIQEQIAADELWPDNLDLYDTSYAIRPEKVAHLEARVGTSLYGFGPSIGESTLDAPKLRYERLTDWVDMTGAAFMGLTMECARCHDHKFDPITQQDYFRMQAIFAPSHPVTLPVVTAMSMFHRNEYYPRAIALDERRRAHEMFEAKVRLRLTEEQKAGFSPEVRRAYEKPEAERTADEQKMAAPLQDALARFFHRNTFKLKEHLTPEEKEERSRVLLAIAEKVLEIPVSDASHAIRWDGFYDTPSATVLGHVQGELIPETRVLERGDLDRPGEPVEAGLPRILDEGVDFNANEGHGPRYRKRLALWLTRPDHPLTARVMVNRLWQWHFGRGIVSSSNDFGLQGQPPSHPELLDWLATEFIRQGWSLKAMHRLIVQSSTYRRTSRFHDAHNAAADPDNAYLWRGNRRRVEAEALWDSIHAVAGTLNSKMYGRPVVPPLSEDELAGFRLKWAWTVPADPAEHARRGIYILARRNFVFPMFEKFDTPDPAVSCPERAVTTVAPQSLWLLNNDAVFRQALAFAGRLVREGGPEPDQWVDRAWRIALGRGPTDREAGDALETLASADGETWKELPEGTPPELKAIGRRQAQGLTELCLAIFNLNEFLFVD